MLCSLLTKRSLHPSKFVSALSVITAEMSQNASRLVETEAIGNVFLIGINRPEKRNAVNQATAVQLYEAIEKFEASEDLRAAVLYGKGGNFCAGYDLSELSLAQGAGESIPEADLLPKGRGPMGPSRKMISKPVIAAVSGYAVAGGLELACMCDLRVVEQSAIFGVFCRRFGVPLIDGGTVRLPQMIGLSRALDMILTGRPVTAAEALQMGLANRVVPVGAALGEATKLAQTISNFPQECLLRDRQSAFNSCFDAASLEEAFKFEYNNGLAVIAKESVSGAKRFVAGEGHKGSFGQDSPDRKSVV